MFSINTIKSKLRKLVPADRVYLDNKFKKIEHRFPDIDHKFQSLDHKLQGLDDRIQLLDKRLSSLDSCLSDLDRYLKEFNQGEMLRENILREIRQSSQTQINAIGGLKQYVNQELQRRDDWGKRASEIARTANGRSVWVIKCPAPEGTMKVGWGDYAYAVTLKRYLERLGIYTVLDTREDWGCEENADVVLVLRGCCFYRPDRRNSKCLYIMWNISHPEMVTAEEYELYDVICVGSRYYAEQLKQKLSVPVFPLLQCTDTELFCPAENKKTVPQWNYIFVGNSRGIARSCVMWAVEERLPIRIWGNGWNKILPDDQELVEAPFIENSQIPDLYRSAKVTLNDHWEDMREKQFVNNRVFDALACGLPVISDTCQELQDIFPDAVLYYSNKEEFRKCIRQIEENYDEIKERVLDQWNMIQEEYSFECRAKQLVEIADKYKH